ncbi:hypothetical protein LCGC14_0845240 [marine sediment metagenome]|uniref:Uncharacterized protein n=1 Tax=marine sediment metagenome TaxID=412755 RepID=A0A0F9BRJ8_9ZZZZ
MDLTYEQLKELSREGANSDHNLAAGDVIKLYVANIGATRDL